MHKISCDFPHADKKIYDGPCVRNNIPPQVRDSATDVIMLKEDDKPKYLNLREIFVDVNNDELNFYLIENGSTTGYLEDDILQAKIDDNKRLMLIPKENMFGNSFITLMASDYPEEPNATHKLEIIIEPVNDPPQIKNKFRKE